MTLVSEFIRALIRDGLERGEVLDVDDAAQTVQRDFPEHTLETLRSMIRTVSKTMKKS